MFKIVTKAPGLYQVVFAPATTLGQALAVMGNLDQQTKGRIDWFLDADAGNAFMGRARGARA